MPEILESAGPNGAVNRASVFLENGLAKGIRVNQLAKELGIESKAILTRLKSEGLEKAAPNHMSVISLGLSESIREWFAGQGGVATAVEEPPEDSARDGEHVGEHRGEHHGDQVEHKAEKPKPSRSHHRKSENGSENGDGEDHAEPLVDRDDHRRIRRCPR